MVSPTIIQHDYGTELQKLHMGTEMRVGVKGEGSGKRWGLRIDAGLRFCPQAVSSAKYLSWGPISLPLTHHPKLSATINHV